jgi:hypothetical protein
MERQKTKAVRKFLRTFTGSSFPTLSELEDGSQAVVKMKGTGNGTESLLSEFIVNRIARTLNLPVPETFFVTIPDLFPWTYGTDEFDDLLQKSYGVNLGLEYLPDANPKLAPTYNTLAAEILVPLLAIDLQFLNIDRLPKSQNLLEDTQGRQWLVDHGSCFFLAAPDLPLSSVPSYELYQNLSHLKKDVQDLAKRLRNETLAKSIVQEIPESWLKETGYSSETIMNRIQTKRI